MATRKAVLLRRDIITDISKIPRDEYLKVASNILKLEPQERREDEIQTLLQITENLQFFKEINEKKSNQRNKLHQQICTKMRYEASKKGTSIIEFGAQADKFFVLLKGSVLIFLQKAQEALKSQIEEELSFMEDKINKSPQVGARDRINSRRKNSSNSNSASSPHIKPSICSNSFMSNQGNTSFDLNDAKNKGGSPLGVNSLSQHNRQIEAIKKSPLERKGSLFLFESINADLDEREDAIKRSSFHQGNESEDQEQQQEESPQLNKLLKPLKRLMHKRNDQREEPHVNNQTKSIFGKQIHKIFQSFEPIVERALSEIHQQQSMEAHASQNVEMNPIKKQFSEKYLHSKIFGNLNSYEIDQPERFIHHPSLIFKFYFLRTLECGSTFGELGLLDGKPRSALILCAEDCEFGVMSKEDYQELLGNIHRREIERKFKFVKDHFLPEITSSSLKKIYQNFQKVKFKRNDFIFRQGDLSNGVYLIKKGEIQLQKELVNNENSPHDNTQSEEQTHALPQKRQLQRHKKQTLFATLGCGEYFAEEFLIFDFKFNHFRSYSAQVSSLKSSLYFMPTSFLKQSPELLESFKQNVKTKITRRQEYIEAIQEVNKNNTKILNPSESTHEIGSSIIQKLNSMKDYLNGSNHINLSPKSFHSKSLKLSKTRFIASTDSLSTFNSTSDLKSQTLNSLFKPSSLRVIGTKGSLCEYDNPNFNKGKTSSFQTKSNLLVPSNPLLEKESLQSQIQLINEEISDKKEISNSKVEEQSNLKEIPSKLNKKVKFSNFHGQKFQTEKNVQKQNHNLHNNDSCHVKEKIFNSFSHSFYQNNLASQNYSSHNNSSYQNQNQSNFVSPSQKPSHSAGQLPSKQNINIKNIEELQEFFDLQQFETKYNEEKLNELQRMVSTSKEKKRDASIIDNPLEFLYMNKTKQFNIRIEQAKKQVQNTYKIELDHFDLSNQIKNRQDMYQKQNTPNFKMQQIFKKVSDVQQDGYDKIIRYSLKKASSKNDSPLLKGGKTHFYKTFNGSNHQDQTRENTLQEEKDIPNSSFHFQQAVNLSNDQQSQQQQQQQQEHYQLPRMIANISQPSQILRHNPKNRLISKRKVSLSPSVINSTIQNSTFNNSPIINSQNPIEHRKISQITILPKEDRGNQISSKAHHRHSKSTSDFFNIPQFVNYSEISSIQQTPIQMFKIGLNPCLEFVDKDTVRIKSSSLPDGIQSNLPPLALPEEQIQIQSSLIPQFNSKRIKSHFQNKKYSSINSSINFKSFLDQVQSQQSNQKNFKPSPIKQIF